MIRRFFPISVPSWWCHPMFFAYCSQTIDPLLLLIRPHSTKKKQKGYVYQNTETPKISIICMLTFGWSVSSFTIVTEESEFRIFKTSRTKYQSGTCTWNDFLCHSGIGLKKAFFIELFPNLNKVWENKQTRFVPDTNPKEFFPWEFQ